MANLRWKRNTAGLRAAVLTRAAEARARAEVAIDALVAEDARVNFNTVSARAGVTKAYLYTQYDLRQRIESLRPSPAAPRLATHGDLEAEVRRLRMELEVALGAVNR